MTNSRKVSVHFNLKFKRARSDRECGVDGLFRLSGRFSSSGSGKACSPRLAQNSGRLSSTESLLDECPEGHRRSPPCDCPTGSKRLLHLQTLDPGDPAPRLKLTPRNSLCPVDWIPTERWDLQILGEWTVEDQDDEDPASQVKSVGTAVLDALPIPQRRIKKRLYDHFLNRTYSSTGCPSRVLPAPRLSLKSAKKAALRVIPPSNVVSAWAVSFPSRPGLTGGAGRGTVPGLAHSAGRRDSPSEYSRL
jgi:hypothetical protein